MKRTMIVFMLSLSILLGVSVNPGTRHETAHALSAQAEAYYCGESSYEALSALAGSASNDPVQARSSPLCAALHSLMTETRSFLPNYQRTIRYFPQTDANAGGEEALRFYCDDYGDYNREQVWAESHGTFYHNGAGCDLHHLRPASADANFVRGSMCFGMVQGNADNVTVWPESGEPVFHCAEAWGENGLVEPRDDVKGDVARILLYVYVSYGDAAGGTCNLWADLPPAGTGVESSDGRRVIESLETLLKWMRLDPVDEWEIGRNDVVQSIQGNRNVFIDYPELAFLLFDRQIPDMPTPSGIAHSLHCSLIARAEPPEGGSLYVEGRSVTAQPAAGWALTGWSLEPANAATVTWEGERFTLSPLRADCCLTVYFTQEDPCPDGHSWDAGSVSLEPGCEQEGERRYVCTVCGAERTEPIPAMGHDWDDGTVIREPSKTEPGERRYLCLRCGATRSEQIPFRFVDVADETLWYFTPVYWALYHEPPITSGTDDSHFSPHLACTRAQVVTFLWRASGSPEPTLSTHPFLDVPPDAYYAKPVLWALEREITAGSSPTSFSPDKPCTRGEIVTFLWAMAERPEPEQQGMPFTDVPAGSYFYKPVLWAVQCGITAGTASTSFSPAKLCTRAEVVTMLWRLLKE